MVVAGVPYRQVSIGSFRSLKTDSYYSSSSNMRCIILYYEQNEQASSLARDFKLNIS